MKNWIWIYKAMMNIQMDMHMDSSTWVRFRLEGGPSAPASEAAIFQTSYPANKAG